jgi:molecular chaperone HtpG
MQKGSIRVQTENIFPIIKKFLYSDHEIFVRELVSNATDACQKLKTLSSIGEAKGDLGELRIDVKIDAAAKTLTISDTGLGMTSEEVDKYLNQVAFSGAEEFVKKHKDASVIGHFGLGFYSAFMVSDKVEVVSKSFKEGNPATRWECDGSPEFELTEADKTNRGTDIILHINEESIEFLQEDRIKGILNKFCRFLPIPIYLAPSIPQGGSLDTPKDDDTVEVIEEGEKSTDEVSQIPPSGGGGALINNTNPAWTRKPSELTDEDYKNFYKELYPFNEPPLFWIHLNVDYPFNLTGILYFPKIKQSYEIQKDKIQLYCNQVFVTDEVKDIVPEFLMLLQGVIDSPDIPLNVSRSYLQGDPNVKKINSHITKKVADKLEEIFNTDRKAFEEKWESLGLFVKYGMITDDKFLEKANKFHIMQTAQTASPNLPTNRDRLSKGGDSDPENLNSDLNNVGSSYTLTEYKEATDATQKNKDGKTVIVYTTDLVQQDSYIKAATDKGYKVVLLNTLVDASFVSQVEHKWENVVFTRVDADIADNLIDKQEDKESVLSKDDSEKLKNLFSIKIEALNVTAEVKGLSVDAAPVVATRPEFMRRMKDMASMGGGMAQFYAQMPDEVNLTINGNHPIYKDVVLKAEPAQQEKLVRNLADLALLSQGLLKGNDLTSFINRSVELIGKN